MIQKKSITNLVELLRKCVLQSDPMLSMLGQQCARLIKAEIFAIIGVDNQDTPRNEASDVSVIASQSNGTIKKSLTSWMELKFTPNKAREYRKYFKTH